MSYLADAIDILKITAIDKLKITALYNKQTVFGAQSEYEKIQQIAAEQ